MDRDIKHVDCENTCATQEDLEEIARQMPPSDELQELAHFFKVFGDHLLGGVFT